VFVVVAAAVVVAVVGVVVAVVVGFPPLPTDTKRHVAEIASSCVVCVCVPTFHCVCSFDLHKTLRGQLLREPVEVDIFHVILCQSAVCLAAVVECRWRQR
jgi:hypothetical protein